MLGQSDLVIEKGSWYNTTYSDGHPYHIGFCLFQSIEPILILVLKDQSIKCVSRQTWEYAISLPVTLSPSRALRTMVRYIGDSVEAHCIWNLLAVL
jgi:hypothetical protein